MAFLNTFVGNFLRIVVLDRRKCVILEMHGILYMKKVTEFREIPHGIRRNSAGILANSARNTELTEVKKTDGIPCRRNSVDTLGVCDREPGGHKEMSSLLADQ